MSEPFQHRRGESDPHIISPIVDREGEASATAADMQDGLGIACVTATIRYGQNENPRTP
jgi:hypothetical protein